MKTRNYKAGDCFTFKEGIRDFGLVFLEEGTYPDGKQYHLFPVQLDTAMTGMDQFRYGKAYLTRFPDMTKPSGSTEGFMAYLFLQQHDFKTINNLLNCVGTIPIKEEYKNVTGGTMAANAGEFRYQLDHWEQMFGENARLLSMREVAP